MSFILKNLNLSERDLDFLVEAAFPDAVDKYRLKQIIRDDDEFRNSFISDEKVFGKLMSDDEVLLKISPPLFFEILLRKAASDLKRVGYTIEKTRNTRIPVFDIKEVLELLDKETLVLYMADMLSSFTRVESYAISFRVKKGTWAKIRFSDLDLFSLKSYVESVDEEYRLGFYKRIGDICLFILGIFPEYAEREYRYPFSGLVRPRIGNRLRVSPEEYEKEGRKFYRLAAESAKEVALAEVFWVLHENFKKAKKPLNFIAEHYLHYKKHAFFG